MFHFHKNGKCTKAVLHFKRFCSSISKISDIFLRSDFQNKIAVKGWVKNIRKLKNVLFVDINDGTTHKNLQIVMPKNDPINNLTYGSSVEAVGLLKDISNGGIELVPENVTVLGDCPLDGGYPFAPRKSYSDDYIRQYLHLRNRTSKFSSLLRFRHRCRLAISDYYLKHGYVQIDPPILTSNDCEGAGEVFKVLPDNARVLNKSKANDEDYFDVKTFLTVSGQLHLESAVRSLSQVYCFGPTFRAENSKSRLHLSEFYMIEAESVLFSDTHDLISSVELLIKCLTEVLILECKEDIDNYNKYNREQHKISSKNIENILESKFSVMTFEEAERLLDSHHEELTIKHQSGQSFTKEQELFLVKCNNNIPVFVIDWPLDLKPFYMRRIPGSQSKVQSFDLLCPIVGEVCGGSMREDDYSLLNKKLEETGLSKKLQWYLELRKFGNILTGGYGIGFERLIQVLLGIPNIKDTIPFPRWPHNCEL